VTHSQVNSAKSAPCEFLLHELDCHKATRYRIAFLRSVGEPNSWCSEDGSGRLGCL
jgi:hypothetical protein